MQARRILFATIAALGVAGSAACTSDSAKPSRADGNLTDAASLADGPSTPKPEVQDALPAADAGDAGKEGADASADAPRDAGASNDASDGREAGDGAVATRDSATADIAADAGRESGGMAETGRDAGAETTALADAREAGDTGDVLAPTFAVEMTKSDQRLFYARASNGSNTFGVANAATADNAVAELVFSGNAALGPSDKLSPEFATEIGTNDETFHYGTYRARVQLARCSANEELVNGVFTYFNDGKDHDGDGLVDNSEIDIEILCSDPSIISLTIWSEYTSDTAKKSASRVIRTKTGDYEDTTNDEVRVGSGNRPEFKLAGFPDPDAFYEMGFEWHADRIRYFLVVGGIEVTLWTFTDAKYIPTLPAAFLFNVWHSTDWWSSSGTADYPASDAVMRVDWFRYWKE